MVKRRGSSPLGADYYRAVHVPELLQLDRNGRPEYEDICELAATQEPYKIHYLFPGYVPTAKTEGPTRPAPPVVMRYLRAVQRALYELRNGRNAPFSDLDFNKLTLKRVLPSTKAQYKHQDPPELFGHRLLINNLTCLGMLGCTSLIGPDAQPGLDVYFPSPTNSANVVPPEFEHWAYPTMPLQPGEEAKLRLLATFSFDNTLEELDWPHISIPSEEWDDWQRRCVTPALETA